MLSAWRCSGSMFGRRGVKWANPNGGAGRAPAPRITPDGRVKPGVKPEDMARRGFRAGRWRARAGHGQGCWRCCPSWTGGPSEARGQTAWPIVPARYLAEAAAVFGDRAANSSRHSSGSRSPGAMPRSRQISAITAPSGRRRSRAAISSGVGSAATSGAACGLAGRGRGRGEAGLRGDGTRSGVGVISRPRAARCSSRSWSAAASMRPRVMQRRIAATSVVPRVWRGGRRPGCRRTRRACPPGRGHRA